MSQSRYTPTYTAHFKFQENQFHVFSKSPGMFKISFDVTHEISHFSSVTNSYDLVVNRVEKSGKIEITQHFFNCTHSGIENIYPQTYDNIHNSLNSRGLSEDHIEIQELLFAAANHAIIEDRSLSGAIASFCAHYDDYLV